MLKRLRKLLGKATEGHSLQAPFYVTTHHGHIVQTFLSLEAALEAAEGCAKASVLLMCVRGHCPRAQRTGERTAETTSPVSLPDSADAALDRIEIPQDVVEQISELLTPGSSIIISDDGMSSETREDTDFIVVAH